MKNVYAIENIIRALVKLVVILMLVMGIIGRMSIYYEYCEMAAQLVGIITVILLYVKDLVKGKAVEAMMKEESAL